MALAKAYVLFIFLAMYADININKLKALARHACPCAIMAVIAGAKLPSMAIMACRYIISGKSWSARWRVMKAIASGASVRGGGRNAA